MAATDAEVDELKKRYRKAEDELLARGCQNIGAAFEAAASTAKAGIGRSLNDVLTLVGNPSALYASFYRQIDAGTRMPESNEFDLRRESVDARFFPNFIKDIVFGALTLDGRAVAPLSPNDKTPRLPRNFVEQEDSDDGLVSAHWLDPGQKAHEAYERVRLQMPAIKTSISKLKLEAARKFTRQLVHEQLGNNDEQYAAKTLCNVASSALECFQYSFAVELAEEATRVFPEDYITWAVLSEGLLRLHRYDDAVAYHVSGMAALKSGDTARAIEIFEEGTSNIPFAKQRDYFKTALALAKLAAGRVEEISSELNVPNSPIVNVIQFHAYAKKRDQGRAQIAFTSLANVCPPLLIPIRDEIAARFGFSQRKPIHDEAWLLGAESSALTLASPLDLAA